MQNNVKTLFVALRKARDKTVAAPFWLMALVAFLLRLFVVRPFGALLALVMGVVWCLGNRPRIREFLCRSGGTSV